MPRDRTSSQPRPAPYPSQTHDPTGNLRRLAVERPDLQLHGLTLRKARDVIEDRIADAVEFIVGPLPENVRPAPRGWKLTGEPFVCTGKTASKEHRSDSTAKIGSWCQRITKQQNPKKMKIHCLTAPMAQDLLEGTEELSPLLEIRKELAPKQRGTPSTPASSRRAVQGDRGSPPPLASSSTRANYSSVREWSPTSIASDDSLSPFPASSSTLAPSSSAVRFSSPDDSELPVEEVGSYYLDYTRSGIFYIWLEDGLSHITVVLFARQNDRHVFFGDHKVELGERGVERAVELDIYAGPGVGWTRFDWEAPLRIDMPGQTFFMRAATVVSPTNFYHTYSVNSRIPKRKARAIN
ncbi:hypothetical protein LshimejAT787_0600740 [Lyophyllum shimeji]|uniref:Uncharacterized protein n=1 Tax=Lyophyllum shimeji TaxID=47721 RepID=A0A9P3PP90_LYOSH|nr:hypothetical protein LshimejAT787_0600740 [Lyophyllum shimeji]